jgi:hypothetical protein
MIPPTIPELVSRAGQLPYLREHLALAEGGTACANLERTLASAYEPIYDVTMPGAPQSTSFADAIERYGDELGFQAVTLVTGAQHDPVDAAVDDQTLVAIDRLSRAPVFELRAATAAETPLAPCARRVDGRFALQVFERVDRHRCRHDDRRAGRALTEPAVAEAGIGRNVGDTVADRAARASAFHRFGVRHRRPRRR